MSELNTNIVAVSVYPDRARVTREGTAALQPGSHRLQIAGLPTALDPASVRAGARGTARARLLGVDVERVFHVETPVEQVRALEEQLEKLQDEMAALDAQVSLLEAERQTLQGLSGATETYARGLAYGKIGVSDQMALLAALYRRSGEIDTSLLRLAANRRQHERRRHKLEQELDALRGGQERQDYTASVEVEVSQAGDLNVELTYVVARAGWTPLYDLRLAGEGEEDGQPSLEVGYLAQVGQQTGEDWRGVALTLSTARPALSETLPELDPWYVEPLYVMPQRARREAAPSPSMLSIEMMAKVAGGTAPESTLEEAAPIVEAEEVLATVDGSGAAVTYRVPGGVDVPADGAPHKVTVARFPLSPELDYVSAPKLVEAAYRRATVVNDSPYTLLPGPANLFDGDEFVGATRIELTAPNGKVELYLGPDDRVKVERELCRREVEKRIVGDRRRVGYGYELRLENLLPEAVKVTLHDQIPVPRHEQIKVRLETADPVPAERTELGLLRWELELEPGQERTLRFDFAVEHPRDMEVLNLP